MSDIRDDNPSPHENTYSVCWGCNVGQTRARLSVEVLDGHEYRLWLMISAALVGESGELPRIAYRVCVFGYEITRFCAEITNMAALMPGLSLLDEDGIEVLSLRLTSAGRGHVKVSGKMPVTVFSDDPHGDSRRQLGLTEMAISAQFNSFEVDYSYLPSLASMLLNALAGHKVSSNNPHPPEIFR